MSGTSMDGIDGVLVDLDPAAQFRVLGHVHQAFDAPVRSALFDLNTPGDNELHRAALASNAVARAYAAVVHSLLRVTGVDREAVQALGAHGQTVRHRPTEFDGTGYTCQLLNGALLAELTGCPVVCDFRSRDVAAGGQGAPLVPAFHRAAFAQAGQDIAVLNLGGIANITCLHSDGRTSGHDCGPGNVLLDAWCTEHTGQAYDDDGRWARSGTPNGAFLQQLLAEPYLHKSPPKSTGRDLFNVAWLHQQVQLFESAASRLRPADVQATLAEFSAQAAAADLQRAMPAIHRLLVCGGGALNAQLLSELRLALPHTQVLPVQAASAMQPMQVEAIAFAWLAWAFMTKTAANCTDVTGATGPRLLGAYYPA